MFGVLQLGLGLTPRTGSRGVRAYTALANLASGFVLDPLDDFVLVKDAVTPTNNFAGSTAQAIAAGIIVHNTPPLKYYRTSGGVLAASTALRCRHTSAGVREGIVPEPQRTNKITACKHNPTDTTNVSRVGNASAVLSLVNDAAELAAAGLSTVCSNGNVYKLDNTLGGASTAYMAFAGVTGNTNTHVVSAYVRSTGGATRVRNTSLSGSALVDAGGPYVRANFTFTPAGGSDVLWVVAGLGTVAYAILPCLEEGAFVTSVIGGDTTSAVTRDLDDITIPLSKLPWSATAGTVIEYAQPPQDTSANGARYWMFDDGTSDNRIHTKSGTAAAKQRSATIMAATAEQLSVTPSNNDTAADYKAALAWEANNAQLVVNGSTRGAADTSVTLPTGLTTLRLGGNAAHADTSYPAAALSMLVYLPERLSQADMITRTT